MSAILRARTLAVLPLMLAAILVASMFVLTPSADAATRGERVGRALDIVRNQKGDPYRWGAAGPGAFDCSGLVYYSFRKAGFTAVPRTASQQSRFADRIRRDRMKKGDLMFFYDGGGVYHVAVFAGWRNGKRQMIHAPYGGQRVHRATPWTNKWFPGTLR